MHLSIILFIILPPLVVNGFMFTSIKKDIPKKQKEYTRKLLQETEIRITDRILYNKDVTYSFFLKLCPSITEVLIDYYSEYYILKNLSKEFFEKNMTDDVGEIFMETIYTSKNYPSYHTNVTLNIDMNDIITYHELHCNAEEYDVNNTYMMDMKKKMVYKEKTQKLREININLSPTYEMVHEEYNEQLCPFIKKYVSIKKYNISDTYHLEYDIYEKFIDDIYTPGHYGNIYNPTVSVSKITYNDANTYWENHCSKYNRMTNMLAIVPTILLLFISLITAMLIKWIKLKLMHIHYITGKYCYKYFTKNE